MAPQHHCKLPPPVHLRDGGSSKSLSGHAAMHSVKKILESSKSEATDRRTGGFKFTLVETTVRAPTVETGWRTSSISSSIQSLGMWDLGISHCFGTSERNVDQNGTWLR